MRRSKSVLDYKKNNNNLEEENPEANQTGKLTLVDINKIYGKTPYSRKLKKIEDELNQFDPDSLMLKVDPTIHSTKTIKQIQFYYNNIKNEINKYINQEKLEDSLKKKINKIPKQIELLVHPPKVSTIPQNENSSNNNNSNKKNTGDDKDVQKENKPVIDYHYKLKNLETEIGHSYQKYNTIKSKNNKLLIQLEEMRKENIFYMNKLSELKKELKEKEKYYNETKSKVEENINKNNQNDSLNEIIEKQTLLNKKNQEMTDNILDNNSEYIEKKAKKKIFRFSKKRIGGINQKYGKK
jgi:chromosome segregation ATPase